MASLEAQINQCTTEIKETGAKIEALLARWIQLEDGAEEEAELLEDIDALKGVIHNLLVRRRELQEKLLAAGQPRSKGAGGAAQQQLAVPAPDKTLALGDSNVKLLRVFPYVLQPFHVMGCNSISSLTQERLGATVASCAAQLPDEVLKVMAMRILQPYFRYARSMVFGTEAPVAHLMHMVLQEAACVCGASLRPGVSADEATQVVRVGNEWRLHRGPWNAAMEQPVRITGQLGGRSVHQCLITASDGTQLYAGTDLTNKVEQAMKECLCMWLYNARCQHHKPVWVLLSDGLAVIRIEFEGVKGPEGQWPEIKPKMPTANIRGHFRCTQAAQLFDDPQALHPTATTVEAVRIILGAFMMHVTDPPETVEQLEARMARAEEALARETSAFWDHALVQRAVCEEHASRSKRARH